jgi:predicted dehydrogenase
VAAPVRLGLIGAGRWGRNYIRTIADIEGVRLAGVASRNPETARWAPAGCTVVAEWRALLNKNGIDGVIIATPAPRHAEMARAAIEAGLPALVEKPLTLDLTEAIALRDMAVSRSGFFMVGHTHLFHPAYRALKAMAPDYGPIHAIRGEAGNFGPYRPDTPVLWDWGPHDVALCLDLLGAMPEQVRASIVERRPVEGAMGEIIEMSLGFSGGARAEIRFGNLMPKRRWFAAHLEKAVLIYDDLAAEKLTLHAPTKAYAAPTDAGIQIEIPAELPLANVVKAFEAAIRSGKCDLASMQLGVRVIEVLAHSHQVLIQ